jgi:hypothetical protein
VDGSDVGVVGLAGDWDRERGDGDCRVDVPISGITGGGGAGGAHRDESLNRGGTRARTALIFVRSF